MSSHLAQPIASLGRMLRRTYARPAAPPKPIEACIPPRYQDESLDAYRRRAIIESIFAGMRACGMTGEIAVSTPKGQPGTAFRWVGDPSENDVLVTVEIEPVPKE